MKNLLELVKVLNSFAAGEVYKGTEISIHLADGEGDKAKKVAFYVKQRPVMGTDGIESWKFVARQGE
jgi:hypothetical protein